MAEYILEKEQINELLKYLCSLKGLNLMTLNDEVNRCYNKNKSVASLYSKLDKKTFRVVELCEIADVLGYDVVLKKRN